MAVGFMIIVFILIFLFYLSNPRNKVNQWSSISCIFFWLGIAKEVALYDLIPMLHENMDRTGLDIAFAPWHSVFTWMIYTFAMPTMLLTCAYLARLDRRNPMLMRYMMRLIFIPGLILSFIYYPVNFRYYQTNSSSFWITYTILNFTFGAITPIVIIKGINTEDPGRPREQKKRAAVVMLPPMYYWLLSVFIPNLLKIEGLFSLWKTNFFLILSCLAVYIYSAFRDGFMGLKLFSMQYDWDMDLSIINTSAEFTSHMFKNQATKMDICIEQLKSAYLDGGQGEIPEELEILSRSVDTLKAYVERIKRHSQEINLQEAPSNLRSMLEYAMSIALADKGYVSAVLDIEDDVYWICDRVHITEVFVNIFSNAVDAMAGGGYITVSSTRSKAGYRLFISDNGSGIDAATLKNIFVPHFTTKNTEESYGLGLAYCKNVVTKHNGGISAKSELGEGTTIIIDFPIKKVEMRELVEAKVS
ncbi:MAG: HAMP domain-containing histidine kinase [Oscillospiraceae bacterium]|nr:HAMP domain-containing histidine kinase [Oscillospiraceae bacterium]